MIGPGWLHYFILLYFLTEKGGQTFQCSLDLWSTAEAKVICPSLLKFFIIPEGGTSDLGLQCDPPGIPVWPLELSTDITLHWPCFVSQVLLSDWNVSLNLIIHLAFFWMEDRKGCVSVCRNGPTEQRKFLYNFFSTSGPVDHWQAALWKLSWCGTRVQKIPPPLMIQTPVD